MHTHTSGERGNLNVVARPTYRLKPLTRILGNYAQFFMLLIEMGRRGELQAGVSTKQATPLFVDKLAQLCIHLEEKLQHTVKVIDRLS